MQKLHASGEGPTTFTMRMIEVANTCCGFGGEVFPWRAGGGILEMPAREYEAVMIVRAIMQAPKPQGG